MSEGEEIIYYTAKFENIHISSNPKATDKILSKNEMTSNILDKQSDWEVAVHSFQIKFSIPLFIFPIKQGANPDPNLSDYVVQIAYGGNFYLESLIFVTQTATLPPPPPTSNQGVQDFSNLYYYVYNIQHFILLVNVALGKAHTDLVTDFPGLFSSSKYPYIIYNEESGLLSLIVPYEYYVEQVVIAFNRLLGDILYGFNYLTVDYDQFGEYVIMIDNPGNKRAYAQPGSVIPPLPANPEYLELKQEQDGRYNINNINSIIFTSDSIKTRPEYLPQTINPNSFSLQNINSLNPNFNNVLSYFNIFSDANGSHINWVQPQYYQPFIHKWINLISDESLNRIQIKMFYELQSGELIQAKQPSNTTSKITLIFRRKKKSLKDKI